LLAPPLPLHTQNLQINWWCPILPFSLFTKLTYLVSAWGSIMAEWFTWALLYQHTIS
jgi:hypothetical protein